MVNFVKYDFMILWFYDFSQTLGMSSSSSNGGIFKISIVIESFNLVLFTSFYKQFYFIQAFMPNTWCNWVRLGVFCIFLCGYTQSPTSLYPSPLPPQLMLSCHLIGRVLALNYGASADGPQHVRLEKTGTEGIEEYLHSTYDRLLIGPPDIIRIILNFQNVVFFREG